MPVHTSRSGGRGGNLRRLGSWARSVLAAADCARLELSVVLGDDAFVAGLNEEWRQKEGPTDVLSFPQDGPDGPLLGDVVISVDTAARQAAELGHDLDDELKVLLVHGICHLLGHDHHSEAETEAMRALETRLLGALDTSVASLVGRAGAR